MFLVAIAVKWTVIGRYRPGSYPLWGSYYFRWWFTQGVLTTVPTTYLVGTPLLAIFYRLLGARIGHNVYLGSDNLGCFDLLTIGEGASIGTDAHAMGYSVSNGTPANRRDQNRRRLPRWHAQRLAEPDCHGGPDRDWPICRC